MVIKDWIRRHLLKLPFAVSENIKNDQLTIKVIQQLLNVNSCCIDVGCHKGEILDVIIANASNGHHIAFEPIPYLYKNLKVKYIGQNISLFDTAVSDYEGTSTFNLVKTNPAYSGLIKRKYDRENEQDEIINVTVNTLDNIIGLDKKIDFIKIDTEGGEFGVLKGAEKLISKWKPTILFEFGIGASDYYGTTTEQVFQYFDEKKMNIYTQSGYLNKKQKLNFDSFNHNYKNQLEYVFVASKE